jgi:hypothetical protein
MMMLIMMLAYIHDIALLHERNQLKFCSHLQQFKILRGIKWMLKLHFLMMIFQKKYIYATTKGLCNEMQKENIICKFLRSLYGLK